MIFRPGDRLNSGGFNIRGLGHLTTPCFFLPTSTNVAIKTSRFHTHLHSTPSSPALMSLTSLTPVTCTSTSPLVSPCTCQNLSYPQPLRATDVSSTCFQSGQPAQQTHHDFLISTVWALVLPCLLRYLPLPSPPPPCTLNRFLLFASLSPLSDPPGEDPLLELSSQPSLPFST